MEKVIPTIFEATTSLQDIILSGESNLSRIKVRAFTKYGNRNGSYITDEVANQLIQSATEGDTPVIGFFDPSTKTWASHTGPTLASAYGYVESFLGWEPFTDTDGVQREYAVFSVVLFTKYYDEAKNILGQNHSMELDSNSIEGQWTEINGQEYYVYTKAKILGFCIIGSHEPCFSVSAFFAKKDENELSSLMNEFKLLVEEAKNNFAGGDQPMNTEELEVSQEEVIEEISEQEVTNNEPAPEFEVENQEEEITTEETVVEETTSNEQVEETTDNNDNQLFEQLQNSYNELQASFEAMQGEINELRNFQETANTELEQLRNENQQLHATIETYESQLSEQETEKKNNLINKYEKLLDEEEINNVREHINDFSYDEIESKLAISFANHQIASEQEVTKVPLPEPQESQFALLMKKYRKN